ncbi:50S ribosomal protein L30 [candidate division WOR-3 bacterium]|nr:50S ribosomal protein L30 [candidate division WOR-3 bacterium]
MKKFRITQTKSPIGRNIVQKRTIFALGLRRIRDSVIKEDTPQIRGMIEKVKHLVNVEELTV